MNRLTNVLLLVGLLTVNTGCGPKADPAQTEDAQAALTTGVEAYEKADWDLAIEQLSIAIDIGGINPDHYGDALIKRAVCLARAGRYEEAHKDLGIAEQGADMAQVYAARSYAFEKEGKSKEAADAMREAKKYNRNVKKIQD